MRDTCSYFENQSISHNSIDDIIRYQFCSEGIKRAESFLFEYFLRRRLEEKNTLRGLHFTFGWCIGFNSEYLPAYWFRYQENEDDWNKADDRLVQTITEANSKENPSQPAVLRISLSKGENAFYAQKYDSEAWGKTMLLSTALSNLPLKKRCRPVRDTGAIHFDNNRYEIATKWMRRNSFNNTITSLSSQRRLINCILAPALGGQVVDLDAVILTPENSIRIIEFKRKYPARGMRAFGLDLNPHISLLRYLSTYSIAVKHIVLVPPVWDKHESPLELLERDELRKHWCWLVADLDDLAIGVIKVSTSGQDSGQSGEERTQHNLQWDAIHMLHEGLKLSNEAYSDLFEFLAFDRPLKLSKTTYEQLVRRTTVIRRNE